MGDISILSLRGVLPELYLVAMIIFLLMVAVYKCKRVCGAMISGTLITLAGTGWYLTSQLQVTEQVSLLNGMFATSNFIAFSKILVLTAAAMSVLIGADWLREKGGYPSEFLILILLSVLGMLCMISANDMLTLYMALELSSLALYVLASFTRDTAKSSEAGLKYFVLGALASGMMLFGMSLVYGFSGTTSFDALTELFTHTEAPYSRGLILGMILVIIGFCFKLSAVPVHMWAPDVYEGAPTPVTAFFATAPKIAAFILFLRVLAQPFGALADQWQQVILFVSVTSLAVGALAAIKQTNMKRLLAYSSIGHVGFILIGLAAGGIEGVQAILLYLSLYIFMSAGAFGCVLMMRRNGEYVEDIKELSGLGQTHPVRAAALSVFMFSMAGIPPLSGFFGKLYVLLAAVNHGLVWLAVIGVTASVVSGYYYLKIVKVMYFDEPAASFDQPVPLLLKLGVAVSAIVTLFFCAVPSGLIGQIKIVAQGLVH
jgi:NADH-quinone oxidoreductase subunit N